MKKFVLLAVISAALSPLAAMAQTQSYTGVVSDAMCASNAKKASSPEHAACAEKCIKGGSPAVLVVGNKVYKVSNPDKIAPYAGKSITVDGSLADGTLTVETVKPS